MGKNKRLGRDSLSLPLQLLYSSTKRAQNRCVSIGVSAVGPPQPKGLRVRVRTSGKPTAARILILILLILILILILISSPKNHLHSYRPPRAALGREWLEGTRFRERASCCLALDSKVACHELEAHNLAMTSNRMLFMISRAVMLICLIDAVSPAQGAIYFGNGIKIGEVTPTSAIIWTRLTSRAELRPDGVAFSRPALSKGMTGNMVDASLASREDGYCAQIPIGTKLSEVLHAMPAVDGQIRVSHRVQGESDWVVLDWEGVDETTDSAMSFPLLGLIPETRYQVRVEGRSSSSSDHVARLYSVFATAPDPARAALISFTVVTGQSFNTRDDSEGQLIYSVMRDLRPSFFVHTGDIVYYDKVDPWVTHLDLARFKWNRSYGQPRVRRFHNEIPSYFIKDDHDSWQNDCWPSMREHRVGVFNWEQGRQTFLEQVPMSEKTYRTRRWGKDLQVWLVEGRDYRTSNDDPDGPNKTIWGAVQTEWFERTVKASDATFRVLISPTPILGPDHMWKAGKMDNHVAEGRAYEGDRLRAFLGSQEGLFIVCGDRHWQYVSHDAGLGLTEYSCGPTTNQHATELKNDDHTRIKYLNPIGGFLRVAVNRDGERPEIQFEHYDVTGEVRYQERHRR